MTSLSGTLYHNPEIPQPWSHAEPLVPVPTAGLCWGPGGGRGFEGSGCGEARVPYSSPLPSQPSHTHWDILKLFTPKGKKKCYF